jgi:hypothetical protein
LLSASLASYFLGEADSESLFEVLLLVSIILSYFFVLLSTPLSLSLLSPSSSYPELLYILETVTLYSFEAYRPLYFLENSFLNSLVEGFFTISTLGSGKGRLIELLLLAVVFLEVYF